MLDKENCVTWNLEDTCIATGICPSSMNPCIHSVGFIRSVLLVLSSIFLLQCRLIFVLPLGRIGKLLTHIELQLTWCFSRWLWYWVPGPIFTWADFMPLPSHSFFCRGSGLSFLSFGDLWEFWCYYLPPWLQDDNTWKYNESIFYFCPNSLCMLNETFKTLRHVIAFRLSFKQWFNQHFA